jgi:hypothetical protein
LRRKPYLPTGTMFAIRSVAISIFPYFYLSGVRLEPNP